MSEPATETDTTDVHEDADSNTVAMIGLILTLIAGLMCSVLFAAASRLPEKQTGPPDDPPATKPEFGDSELAAQQLQVLVLASATAVLNLVGLVLSIAGLFLPNRPRAVAICGTILAFALFAGVFGVMAMGAFLTPSAAVPSG